MAKTKKVSKTAKNNLAEDVTLRLAAALESFKDIWGEKRFNKKIKKASKHFLKGIPKNLETKVAIPAKKKVTKEVHSK